MNQLTFVLLTSTAVFMMFAFGWVAGIIHQRLRRGSSPESLAIERLANELAMTERERDRFANALKDRELEMAKNLAERDELYHQAIDRLRDAEMRLNRMDGNR